MDLGTIVGVVLGLFLIIGSIMMGSPLSAFIDIPSIGIVGGGTISAILIAYPVGKVAKIMSFTMKAILDKKLELKKYYSTIVDMATIARRDGVLALEEKLQGIDEPFLRKGLQMMVDGNTPEAVSAIMTMEIERMEERHALGSAMWNDLANYAPAFGMIGTLIGLVQMLKNMSDPSSIGASMAVALITTFYGAVVANLFCTPFKNKLEQKSGEEITLKKMLLCGIMSIQAGDSPRIVGDKLLVYIAPSEREALVPQK